MRKFNIKVDGKNYQVEVEEINGGVTPLTANPVAVQASVSAPVAQAPVAKPAPAPVKVEVAAGAFAVNAPMPGLILEVKVASGATIKEGDVIVVLEAMKMANDITAPKSGVVTVAVAKGVNVNAGDLLYTIA
ncbi:MAG: biotin/lipoyl-containing protein [Clostridia bacterium]